MEFFETFIPVGIVLVCLAGVIALIALAYLFVVLSKTIKEAMFKVNPLLDNAQDLITDAKPLVKKADPMMDRITLTIDAANLEIMRVDQILEDVNTVTGNVAKASNSVDSITSAPLDAISNLTKKIRERLTPVASADGSVVSNVAQTVDSGLSSVNDKIETIQAENAEKKAEAHEAAAKRDDAQAKTDSTAAQLKRGVFNHIDSDTKFVE